MPIPISSGSRVVFCGDSITDQGVFGPAIIAINEQLPDRLPARARATSGRAFAGGAQRAVCATVPREPIVAIISGVPGDTIASIAANVPGRITNYNPDVVFMFIGVNDCLHATALAPFNADYDTVLAAIAAYGDIPVCCMSIFEIGEQWVSGPLRWDNHYDPPPSNPSFTPSIAQYDSEIQTAIADSTLSAAEFLDLRAPTLVYEGAHNTPEPGAPDGVLTYDGVHPNARGQNWISGLVVANCNVT